MGTEVGTGRSGPVVGVGAGGTVAVGEVEIGMLAAGEGGEGKTVGVDESAIDTLVDIGLSASIDADGRVAK